MLSFGFRKSLYVLAGVVCACFLLTALGSVWQTRTSARAAERIYVERTAPSMHLMQAVDALHRARETILIALSEETDVAAEKHLVQLKGLDEAMNAALGRVAESAPDQKEAIAQLKVLIADYIKARDQSVQMIQVGDLPSALGNIKLNAGPKFDKVLAGLSAVIDSQARLALEDHQATSGSLQVQMWAQMAINSAALVLVVILTGWVMRRVLSQLNEVSTHMARVVKEKDFTIQVPIRGRDEIASVAQSFNALLDAFRGILKALEQDVSGMDATARQLTEVARGASESVSATSASAASMAAAVEEMSVGLDQMKDRANEAMGVVSRAGAYSHDGGEVIHAAVQDLEHISSEVRQVAERIVELGGQTRQISTVVELIRQIAEQTNLLALNAAIEAARAGEHGRGFAVVADEVRKLAESTALATRDISATIKEIQQSARAASETMQGALKDANAGTSLGVQAGSAVSEIRQATAEVHSVFQDIAAGIAEQSSAGQSLASNVEVVAQAADASSAVVVRAASAAQTLESLAGSIRSRVSQFRV